MRIPLPLNCLFGAQEVVSTKGPHWRIRQFAGFSVTAERCYSFTYLLQNLTNKTNEVTLSYGVALDSASASVNVMLAPGELRAVLVPMVQDGRNITIRCSQDLALLDCLGHQISSAWIETSGVTQITGLALKKFPASLVGDLPAGASGQVSCKEADCHYLQLSSNAPIAILANNWALKASGFFTLLLDAGTVTDLQICVLARTSFSFSSKHFSDKSSQWVPPSGMPVWVV